MKRPSKKQRLIIRDIEANMNGVKFEGRTYRDAAMYIRYYKKKHPNDLSFWGAMGLLTIGFAIGGLAMIFLLLLGGVFLS